MEVNGMRRVRRLASLVVATCALIVSVRDAGAQKAPRSDPQVNRTSWGAVVGRVYTASDGAPIVGARVTVRNDRMFADKGPTCGVTDETGKYAVQAPLGRVSENFDIGRALNSGIAGLLLGGATNRTKRVDVTRLDMKIEATGYRSYAGPVNCRRSEPERFSVTMEPVLMTPAGEREVSAPADGWGAAYVLAVTVEPEVALGGEDVTVRARVRLPLALPRRDVVVLCTSSTLGRRRMETVVSQADGVAVLEMKARAPRPRRSVLDTVTAAIERCPVDVSAGADVGTATYQVISTESDRANAVLRAEALSAEASQDYAVAAARWKAVCAAQEASPDDYRRLAEAASRVHDHGTAAQALAKAVEVAPERDRPDAMGLHAAALVRAGDPAGVVSAYGPMHGSRPAKDRRLRLSPLLLSALGESYVLTGRLDEARAVRDDLHALEGRLPDAAIRFRNGLRLAEAARAASEKDRDAAAKAAYGRALVDLERFEEAAAPLRQATQLDPLLMAPTADLAFAYDRLAPTPRAGVKDLDF
ncbi:MAG: hypothetical protein FJX72_07180, partial [Armatimonadetes bacterium]|nr:hypothetical protein [Armatimonadota bacterium]